MANSVQDLIQLAQFKQQQKQNTPLRAGIRGLLQNAFAAADQERQEMRTLDLLEKKKEIEDRFEMRRESRQADTTLELERAKVGLPQSASRGGGRPLNRKKDLEELGAKNRQNAQKKEADAQAKLDRERKDKRFDQAGKLQDDFVSQSRDFLKIQDAYARIQASGIEPSAAGDLALIFNYMKILDPGSTVREGEFANAQNSGSAFERGWALYNRIARGERLSESQRADFLDRSEKLFNAQRNIQEQRITLFEDRADRAGLNPEDVVQPIFQFLQEASGVEDTPAEAPAEDLGGYSEEDIQHTMQVNGMSREEVLQLIQGGQ